MPRPGGARRFLRSPRRGYRYVVNGFDLKIPYAATCVVTLRSLINKRGPVIGRFMRAMAEATQSDAQRPSLGLQSARQIPAHHRHRKFSTPPTIPKSPPWNTRLEIHEAALQASLDEIAPLDARAKAIKPADMIDRRYLVELEKSGVFANKREAMSSRKKSLQ